MTRAGFWWHRHRDVYEKCLWTIFLITIYLLGQQIFLPNADVFSASQNLQDAPFLQVLSLTTGGQLGLPTILSLGMQPYMTTLIVWQAVTSLDLESVRRLSQKRISLIQRCIAIVLGSIQAISFVVLMGRSFVPNYVGPQNIDIAPAVAVVTLVAGSLFTMWLADQNAERGIGGTVTLILPGLLAGLPTQLQRGMGNTPFALTRDHLIVTAVITLLFIMAAVYLNQAELRLPLREPLLENRFTASYLPIKLLASGGMPFMFSMSLFTFPAYFFSGRLMLTAAEKSLIRWFSVTHWQGILVYSIIIIVLGFAFGYITLQPVNVARQLKESGDYFPGIIPGTATNKFLTGHFIRLTIWGSGILLLIGTLPLVIGLHIPGAANFSQYLGGLLILVTILQGVLDQLSALWHKNQYTLF